nr:HA protein [Quaranjavirus sp.]
MMSFLFYLTVFGSISTVTPHCSDKECTGPYKLSDPTIPQAPVSNERHIARVYTQLPKVRAYIGYRSRYTAYCYEGGVLDPNTGCYKEHKMVPPSKEEMQDWISKGQCSYGHECSKGGDCWGGDADKCLDSSANLNWAKGKEFQGNNEEWMVFARHSCISTWRCGFHETEFPLYLKWSKGVPTTLTYNSKGEPLDVGAGYLKMDSQTVLLFKDPGPVLSYEVTVHCYQQRKMPRTCQLPEDDRLRDASGLILNIDENGSGSTNNVIVQVSLDAEHPHDKRQLGNKGVSKTFKTSQISSAVSIEDLRPILISMVYEASETNYNLFQLLRSVGELMVTTRKIIESTSKLDDELLGRIMGVQTKTKWFNDHLFHLCPCYQIPRKTNGNCADHFIYKEGRYVPEGPDSHCSSFSDGSVTTLNLTNLYNLTFSTLSYPPPRGTSSSWEGWSWLAEQKENLFETMAFKDETTSSDSSNPLSKLYNEGVSYFSFWTFWSRYMPFVTLVTFVMSLYALIKK